VSEAGAGRRIVLASRSPQRRAILNQLGVAFEAVPAEIDELTDGEPLAVALENARRKAAAVGGEFVLGVDTIVSLDGQIYGKPEDPAHARRSLEALSGRTHTVVSGLCVLDGGEERSATAETAVSFRNVGRELIDWYLACGEWRERAGGYAIQGRGAALVESISGDYLNVVGLPVALLLELCPDLLTGRQ
jgi:septum formation protein